MDARVFEVMEPYFMDAYANPTSIYKFAQKSRSAIERAREKIAEFLQTEPREIIFTSGGTESNNLFIFGAAEVLQKYGRHIITSQIEHDSVIEPLKRLETKGFEVTYLDVGEDGLVKAQDVKKALRDDTILVTIMFANNEIGTIQPIAEIGEVIAEFRKTKKVTSTEHHLYPYFHTDACQAAPYLDISVKPLGIDAMTLNGGKIYGPKGVGALFIKTGTPIMPQLFGGGQEHRMRAGTENVAGIVGFGRALELVQSARVEESQRLLVLRDRLINGLLQAIPRSRVNGDLHKRLPNNVNVSFYGLEGEAILLRLDMIGVAASAGSACAASSLEPSHVMRALGLSDQWTHSATRFTMGHGNTHEEVDFVLKNLPGIIKELREVSPFA